MARRNHTHEHASGTHRPDALGPQTDCNHCGVTDPWDKNFVDDRSAFEKSVQRSAQKDFGHYGSDVSPTHDEDEAENKLGDYLSQTH